MTKKNIIFCWIELVIVAAGVMAAIFFASWINDSRSNVMTVSIIVTIMFGIYFKCWFLPNLKQERKQYRRNIHLKNKTDN